MEKIIIAKEINKKIKWTPDFLLHFLNDINFEVYKGEFLTIAGQSGSGKSTLLDILLGYDKEFEGTVIIENMVISLLSEIELEKFRNEKIGICCDDKAPIELSNTVEENMYKKMKYFKKENTSQEVEEIIAIFNLKSIQNQITSLCTPVDFQRFMIALAFCGYPPIVVVDEILDRFSNDEKNKLIKIIKFLQKKYQITIVMVTHDNEIIMESDRALCIKDKTIYKVDLNKFRTLMDKK